MFSVAMAGLQDYNYNIIMTRKADVSQTFFAHKARFTLAINNVNTSVA